MVGFHVLQHLVGVMDLTPGPGGEGSPQRPGPRGKAGLPEAFLVGQITTGIGRVLAQQPGIAGLAGKGAQGHAVRLAIISLRHGFPDGGPHDLQLGQLSLPLLAVAHQQPVLLAAGILLAYGNGPVTELRFVGMPGISARLGQQGRHVFPAIPQPVGEEPVPTVLVQQLPLVLARESGSDTKTLKSPCIGASSGITSRAMVASLVLPGKTRCRKT